MSNIIYTNEDCMIGRTMTTDIAFIEKMFREYMKLEDRFNESEVEEWATQIRVQYVTKNTPTIADVAE